MNVNANQAVLLITVNIMVTALADYSEFLALAAVNPKLSLPPSLTPVLYCQVPAVERCPVR